MGKTKARQNFLVASVCEIASVILLKLLKKHTEATGNRGKGEIASVVYLIISVS